MADEPTRLERLATAGLPHMLLEPVGTGAGEDGGVGELAYAARSLPETEWNAFLYFFRHDSSPTVVGHLRAWLLTVASGLYLAKGWPRVDRADPSTRYIARLCEVVLVTARAPYYRRTINDRARMMGVSVADWIARLERPYSDLCTAFKCLETRASEHIAGEQPD